MRKRYVGPTIFGRRSPIPNEDDELVPTQTQTTRYRLPDEDDEEGAVAARKSLEPEFELSDEIRQRMREASAKSIDAKRQAKEEAARRSRASRRSAQKRLDAEAKEAALKREVEQAEFNAALAKAHDYLKGRTYEMVKYNDVADSLGIGWELALRLCKVLCQQENRCVYAFKFQGKTPQPCGVKERPQAFSWVPERRAISRARGKLEKDKQRAYATWSYVGANPSCSVREVEAGVRLFLGKADNNAVRRSIDLLLDLGCLAAEKREARKSLGLRVCARQEEMVEEVAKWVRGQRRAEDDGPLGP